MTRILLPLALLVCCAVAPFSGAFAQTTITQTPAPADWVPSQLLGIGFATPPGWDEVERRDDAVTFFGGDVTTRTGPGFTVMMESDPTDMLKEGGFQDQGAVLFDNGAMFRRYTVAVTPEAGTTIAGEFLLSSVPMVNGKFLMAGALGYNVKINDYRAIFDTMFAALGVPAPGVGVVQTALNGAFNYVLPDGWETGSGSKDERLVLEQEGGQGEIRLMRHAVEGAGSHRSGWSQPSETDTQPVMFLGQPALLYEWRAASKYYSDGRDSFQLTRLFIFETCLANGDTGSVEVTGMPDFHSNTQVMRLLDQLVFAPNGAAGVACRAVDLPEGAPLGTPNKGRPEASGFTMWIPAYAAGDGWHTESFGNVGFDLPNSWTGASGVWMSSQGEYQLSLSLTQDAPLPMAKAAELRLPDGTRFFRFTLPDGARAITAAPIGPEGHLVIDVTGSQMDGVGVVDILGTFKLPAITPPPAQTEPQSVLNGLATVIPPQGFDLTVSEDSVRLTAQDGRGFLMLARGGAVLPPDGLIGQLPEGRLGSFAFSHDHEWTEYGWPGTTPVFKDRDTPAEGWYFLNILRECLPNGEPVAFAWGGISRFTGGKTLNAARIAFKINWPDGMLACDPVADAKAFAPLDQSQTAPTELETPTPVEEPLNAAAASQNALGQTKQAPVEPGDWLGKVPAAALPSPATESLAGRWQARPQANAALQNNSTHPSDAVQPETQSAAVSIEAPSLAPPPPEQVVDRDSFTPIAAGYSTYQNDRYGTFISYPSSFFLPEPPPDSGDGRRFTSVDGTARFYVFAQFNALGQSQSEQIAQDKSDQAHGIVSYERAGQGWYVLSGTTNGDIFYRRVIEDMNGLIQVFEITYPLTRKADFDAVVTYMANSFGPGSDMTAAQPTDNASPSTQQNAEPLNIGWWIVVGTFPTEPSQRQSADRARMQSLGARCNLQPFNDFSGKFLGLNAGYNVFVLGAYESKSTATEMLQHAQACYPDAYIKYAEYLGE